MESIEELKNIEENLYPFEEIEKMRYSKCFESI